MPFNTLTLCPASSRPCSSRAAWRCARPCAARCSSAVSPSWCPWGPRRRPCSICWWETTTSTPRGRPSSARTCRYCLFWTIMWKMRKGNMTAPFSSCMGKSLLIKSHPGPLVVCVKNSNFSQMFLPLFTYSFSVCASVPVIIKKKNVKRIIDLVNSWLLWLDNFRGLYSFPLALTPVHVLLACWHVVVVFLCLPSICFLALHFSSHIISICLLFSTRSLLL